MIADASKGFGDCHFAKAPRSYSFINCSSPVFSDIMLLYISDPLIRV